jgi:hypothetical protein
MGDADRAFDGATDDRHVRRAAGRRPVRAAAERRLPRAREPDVSCRDTRCRRAGWDRNVQVVA